MPVHGVAVTVPEPWGAQLQDAREQFGDPMASAIPPHVTLLPPTVVEDEALPGFLDHYNYRRPHRALDRQPPIQRLAERNNLAGTYS